ncbi:MAG TPA: IS30 family transposase [Ramlibacter sp.]|jgi:IS30 family transposase|uniref:IS30 family transposase n=1 Tax=Ramlibacter sp. TaxID=1917967 RepID=UPI002B9D5F1E|nr:IS30 family transposase [Ramlibacter sp.]HVZ42233.1 IS30 family transposase [Ramlibacter sp.]
MTVVSKRGYSGAERAQIWARWRQGEALSSIAAALGKRSSSVYNFVKRHGGIGPRERTRAARSLSLAEREEVSRGISAGLTDRQIAKGLRRAASTVGREIKRNGGRDSYRAVDADRAAWDRARRPKRARLAADQRLNRVVAVKLQLDWSPLQISAWLKRRYAGRPDMQVSAETIYRSLFVQARAALKKELVGHLRRSKGVRHAKGSSANGQGRIVDAISIRERPAEAEDRAVPGHWEGDLLMGGNSSQIATLVERSTRFVMLVKLDTKECNAVAAALARKIIKLPAELRRSLTWDRGTEMAAHKDFSVASEVQVYFCDPRSPWQRGSNENTNGLLRQYFPKGKDVSGFSQAHLNSVAARLNGRPRQTLGWLSPAEALEAVIAKTG